MDVFEKWRLKVFLEPENCCFTATVAKWCQKSGKREKSVVSS